MSESRRRFLKAGLLAALFAAAPVKNLFGQTWKERDGNPGDVTPVQNDQLANYSKAAFVSYLNSIFEIHTVRGLVAVSLAKVDDMTAPKGGECFSLLFRGGRAALSQDTYVVVHPALGTFQLFLVPAGSDQNGAQEYVATVNRISPADFANLSAPSGSAAAAQRSNSQTGSSGSNSTSTGTSTSTGNSTSPGTGPTVTTTIVNSVTTSAGSISSARPSTPAPRRKHKPRRKRVNSKPGVID
jgi:hypothetical protein